MGGGRRNLELQDPLWNSCLDLAMIATSPHAIHTVPTMLSGMFARSQR
jgi:hypothetical protein